jgi:hypothetical protein
VTIVRGACDGLLWKLAQKPRELELSQEGSEPMKPRQHHCWCGARATLRVTDGGLARYVCDKHRQGRPPVRVGYDAYDAYVGSGW